MPVTVPTVKKITEDLKETVRENPKDLAAWVKMENIYAEHHRYREAAKAHSQALSIKPNDPDVRTSLGILLRSWGDDDEAIEEFKRAAQYGPKHANSHYHLGLTLLQNKRNIPEGIKAWEDYLKVEPKGQRANQVRVEIERLRTEMAGDKGQKAYSCRLEFHRFHRVLLGETNEQNSGYLWKSEAKREYNPPFKPYRSRGVGYRSSSGKDSVTGSKDVSLS